MKSWFIGTKIFVGRLSFKTQFKIEYFCCVTDLKNCLEKNPTSKDFQVQVDQNFYKLDGEMMD